MVNTFAQVDASYRLLSPSLEIVNDDTKLTNYIKNNYAHTHHWMGSNRMSDSCETGVVNGYGEVFGVNNLIVADNSIAPVITDGNTCYPAYLIAETIARAILKGKV